MRALYVRLLYVSIVGPCTANLCPDAIGRRPTRLRSAVFACGCDVCVTRVYFEQQARSLGVSRRLTGALFVAFGHASHLPDLGFDVMFIA